jgi:hypothetical protein
VQHDLAIIGNIARCFPGRAHGYVFTIDRGSEHAACVTPALWGEILKLRYKHLQSCAPNRIACLDAPLRWMSVHDELS